MITCYGNPTGVEKICEWTGKKFVVDWKHRKQRFIDKAAMYAWRKSQNREIVNCLTCGKPFERYKRILHPKSGRVQEYCSNECKRSSSSKKIKLCKWMTFHNPMNNPTSREKIKQSKLQRYGLSDYNNPEKMIETNMKRYGVPYAVYLPQCKSNGKRISNFQRRVFAETKQKYPDTELEKYLPDVQRFVDIYIPSIKKAIECQGDYWHCNPSKFRPDYYNKLVHMTANDIWKRDAAKRELLKMAGYDIEVVWENAKKQFRN